MICGFTFSVTSGFANFAVDCLQSWSLFLSEVKNYELYLFNIASLKLSKTLLVCKLLVWVCAELQMPFWHQFTHFHILSTPYMQFFLPIRVASATLFCAFERGILIPTSDSVFTNLYTLQTVSHSPLHLPASSRIVATISSYDQRTC